MTPGDRQVFIDAAYYKIGEKGFVYFFNNGEWVRSTKTADLIWKHIEGMKSHATTNVH